MWLNSLAIFTGNLFRKHPNVDSTGLLAYLVSQLKDGNPFDLVILKELITKMSGVEQLMEGNSDMQLEAMSGGETLRLEVTWIVASFYFII